MILIPTILYFTQRGTPNPKIVFEKETNYYDAKVVDTNFSSYGDSRILVLDFDFHKALNPKKLNITRKYILSLLA